MAYFNKRVLDMVLYTNYIALAIDPFLGPCYFCLFCFASQLEHEKLIHSETKFKTLEVIYLYIYIYIERERDIHMHRFG